MSVRPARRQLSVLFAVLALLSLGDTTKGAVATAFMYSPATGVVESRSATHHLKMASSTSVSLESATLFAHTWFGAWERRSLDDIVDPFAANAEFHSPMVAKVVGEPSGILTNRQSLRAYFQAALDKYPKIDKHLLDILAGKNSVTVYYRSINDLLSCEVFFFNDEGKVCKVLNNYRAPDGSKVSAVSHLAKKWMKAWNGRSFDQLLDCFHENVQLVSPFVAKITGKEELAGKHQVLSYFQSVLEKYPALTFQLLDVLAGKDSVAVYYDSVAGAKECVIMSLDESGIVTHIWNHSRPALKSETRNL